MALTGALVLALAASLTLGLTACGRTGTRPPAPRDADYGPIPAGQSLSSRIRAAGPAELDYLRAIDRRGDYSVHEPTPGELGLLAGEYLALPAAMREVLDGAVVAVALVDGLAGNGMADFLRPSRAGAAPERFILYVSSEVLGASASERLSRREASAFAPDPAGASLRLSVAAPDAQGSLVELPAAWYLVSHEGAHLYDYLRRVTPRVEPGMALPEGESGAPADHALTRGLWLEYGKPEAAADFPGRDKLRFFGLSAPLLAFSDIPAIYDSLCASPFPSLYASTSWAEDWAELFTWSRLLERGGRLRVEIVAPSGELLRGWEPLANPRLAPRLGLARGLAAQTPPGGRP